MAGSSVRALRFVATVVLAAATGLIVARLIGGPTVLQVVVCGAIAGATVTVIDKLTGVKRADDGAR